MKEESGLLVIKSMDKKLATEELKTEFNNSMANSAFSDQIPASFDMQSFDSDMGFNYSCFVDILGSQDFTFSSDLSDLFQPAAPQPPSPAVFMVDQSKAPVFSPATTLLESSEVVNTPATPNSSSISSSFNQNVDLQKKAIDGAEVEDPRETKKQTMKKKPKMEKKKEREPRFAFRTKCEADNLDDGYRWRKYGQKAVKNSPFPRSYYRCTTPQCDVKKRVERSVEDNSILVTTYEGTHIHPCPSTTPRGGGVTAPPVETPYSFLLGNAATGVSGLVGSGNGGGGYLPSIQYHQPQHYQQQQQSFLGGEFTSTFNFMNTFTNNSSLFDHHDLSARLVQDQERRFSGPSSNPIFMDGGLLEDMVTPQMLKKPKVEY